jgi:hypothetical protein
MTLGDARSRLDVATSNARVLTFRKPCDELEPHFRRVLSACRGLWPSRYSLSARWRLHSAPTGMTPRKN